MLSFFTKKCVYQCIIALHACINTSKLERFLHVLARCPCVARNIKILREKRMNEGRRYLQMWRGVRVNCHSFRPIRQIQIGRPILQDARHTIITNSAFYKSRGQLIFSLGYSQWEVLYTSIMCMILVYDTGQPLQCHA